MSQQQGSQQGESQKKAKKTNTLDTVLSYILGIVAQGFGHGVIRVLKATWEVLDILRFRFVGSVTFAFVVLMGNLIWTILFVRDGRSAWQKTKNAFTSKILGLNIERGGYQIPLNLLNVITAGFLSTTVFSYLSVLGRPTFAILLAFIIGEVVKELWSKLLSIAIAAICVVVLFVGSPPDESAQWLAGLPSLVGFLVLATLGFYMNKGWSTLDLLGSAFRKLFGRPTPKHVEDRLTEQQERANEEDWVTALFLQALTGFIATSCFFAFYNLFVPATTKLPHWEVEWPALLGLSITNGLFIGFTIRAKKGNYSSLSMWNLLTLVLAGLIDWLLLGNPPSLLLWTTMPGFGLAVGIAAFFDLDKEDRDKLKASALKITLLPFRPLRPLMRFFRRRHSN